jgi:RNA polymerase sigma-70 factor (ECF subfamily)
VEFPVDSDRRAEEQFRSLYDQYVRYVYRFFLRRVEDENAAQDCTADTFLVAWRRLTDVPKGDRTLPWLYGVARRVLANHSRSKTRSRKLFLRLGWLRGELGPTPEGIILRRSQDQEVIEALHQLRPEDQELLRLSFWEELPNAEISDLLGCSAHAVAQRRHRAANRLARQLGLSGHKEEKSATPRPAPRGETR